MWPLGMAKIRLHTSMIWRASMRGPAWTLWLVSSKPNSRQAKNRDKDNLDGITRGDRPGIGLHLMDGAFPPDPTPCRIEFVHDQWPGFSCTSQSIDVEIQSASG